RHLPPRRPDRRRQHRAPAPARTLPGPGRPAPHARTAFDYTRGRGPLLRGATAGLPAKGLALALDPTCLTDRSQGGALPAAWVVQTADHAGRWNAHGTDLVGRVRQALGDGGDVLVLTDRGLESRALVRAIVALGWHPLMRGKAAGHFRPTGWHPGYAL